MANNNLIKKENAIKENRIWVRIAATCNEKCIFCFDSDAQDGTLISDLIIKKEIRDGYKIGYDNRIIISGGEASIHPKFHEYIAYAKAIGYTRIQTVTNGIMFSKSDFCKRVVDAGLQEITFSFHGHTKQLHDFFTSTPGSFDKALRGLIFLKKNYPNLIINIDIVVNKINVEFLPNIVQFFMRIGIYEFDILQIIPFGRGYNKYKDILFYKVEDHLESLHETWKFSQLPEMNIWTNRFPVEAFEGFEDLIQDPRKIKSETMGESLEMFQSFIASSGIIRPTCFGDACEYCFLNQYCHGFINSLDRKLPIGDRYIIATDGWNPKSTVNFIILRGELFPSQVYKKYGMSGEEFIHKIGSIHLTPGQQFVNLPYCIRKTNNNGLYEYNNDYEGSKSVGVYTENYVRNLYRKKSIRCRKCKYDTICEGIHINFIRSYGFGILNPIKG